MENSEKCVRRRLAERGTFIVEICDCGAVHLTIGFLTLRLDPCAYRALAGALDDALRVLDVRDHQIIH